MKKILLCLYFIFQINQAHAWMIEPYVFTSYGEAAHLTESESPKMFAHGVGASVLFDIFPTISLGASADYRFYAQISEVKSPYGNRTGKRLAISPTLGVKLGPVFFKYYYQMKGDYELDNPTTSGSTVTYSNVTGHTFWASIPFWPLIRLGVFYEMETFEKSINGTSQTNLDARNNELEFNKFGIYLSILI